MTDSDLAKYLGIESHAKCAEIIARLPTARRAAYERMAGLEKEVEDWLAGKGEYPKDVLLDFDDGSEEGRRLN